VGQGAGIEVKDRGRVPAELVAKFKAATESSCLGRLARLGSDAHSCRCADSYCSTSL
jgi:hypothetical protein